MVVGAHLRWVGLAAGLAALVAIPVEYLRTDSWSEAAETLVGVALATVVAVLALSLPGLTARGLAIGGFFVGAGMLSWTFLDRPLAIWGFLLVEGVVLAIWAWPWLRAMPVTVRLAGSWLGISYWLLGIVGALLVWHPTVALQRVAYAGVFGLAVLAVITSSRLVRAPGDQRPARDLSIGVAAGFLLAIAVLLWVGAGALLDAERQYPSGGWGTAMHARFWGGWLLYHPNSIAGISVIVALRIGPDGRFARWQRLAVLGVAAVMLYLTDSRSGFVVLGAAALGHAALLWWARRRPVADLPQYPGRQVWAAAAAPFVALLLVLGGIVVTGLATGKGGIFLTQSRYSDGDPTSGRTATWRQVGVDWQADSLAEKIFGDAESSRAVVHRADSPGVDLTTDNAAVGALRRGGVLGVLAFLVGLGLLVTLALRRGAPGWFTLAAATALGTIPMTDWLLGGTGGTWWIFLVAAEVAVLAALANGERTAVEQSVTASSV